ncbi:hypothetical protein CgunFtcFv8_015251 [Champsocephalus gunnari]|uniref:Uncharacterized protein n=1 Tax=Champsocephalus gunnari TaxID=52237 RepID=A0AAN8C6G0_CHAGU|nr:hypothetical protein CgunFtcFv8_015251 [Champsocephalus gunnari]
MSKASRLARPSVGAGSRLPSPRKESTGRVRVLSVGEKLMRAGSDGILSRQKSLKVAGAQDKAQSETQAEAPRQDPGEKGQHVEMLPPKSKISPPKASSQQPGSVHSEYELHLNGMVSFGRRVSMHSHGYCAETVHTGDLTFSCMLCVPFNASLLCCVSIDYVVPGLSGMSFLP